MHKHLHFCVHIYIYLSLRSESFRINISKPKTFMEILWNISNMCASLFPSISFIYFAIPCYKFHPIPYIFFQQSLFYFALRTVYIINNLSNLSHQKTKKKKKKETIRDSWRELRSASRRKRLASIISHEPLCASSTQWNWIKLQGGGCDPPPLSQPQRSTVVQIVEMVSGDRGGEGTSRETVGREQIASG